MPTKNFLLLSLEDTKIKKVSNVISNDSCRKILDLLSVKEATETEIAQKLGIPISTVHYNLQQLLETGLISAEEFHYSTKGKEISHYRLANKYIIIAPKSTYGIKEKLKSILPIALIAAGTAGAIQLVSNFYQKSALQMNIASKAGVERAYDTASSAISQAAPVAPLKTIYILPSNLALWFLVGALFALTTYFVWSSYKKNLN